jgi:DNA-binding transcriptional LysR family regulator
MTIEELFQRGLSLDKLRSFLAVVQAGSVTAAAKGEASRRSLMSRQVSELERTLGLELFLRQGKSLSLTESGRELALLTAGYFSEFEDLVRRATSRESHLRVGAGASTLDALVFPRINELRRELPNTDFEFATNSTAGILSDLRQGALDIGIVRDGNLGPDLVATPCAKLEFVLVCRTDFDRNLPDWNLSKFLTRAPLAMIRGSGEFVSSFNNLCDELEIEPKITIRTESFDQIRQMMLAGHPAGLLPKPLAASLPATDFHLVDDSSLRCLSRQIAVVIDTRMARMKDRLPRIAEAVCKVIAR